MGSGVRNNILQYIVDLIYNIPIAIWFLFYNIKYCTIVQYRTIIVKIFINYYYYYKLGHFHNKKILIMQLIVIIKPIRISGFDLYNTILISSQLCLKCRRLVKKRELVLALLLVMGDCVGCHWLSTLSKLNMVYEFDSPISKQNDRFLIPWTSTYHILCTAWRVRSALKIILGT